MCNRVNLIWISILLAPRPVPRVRQNVKSSLDESPATEITETNTKEEIENVPAKSDVHLSIPVSNEASIRSPPPRPIKLPLFTLVSDNVSLNDASSIGSEESSSNIYDTPLSTNKQVDENSDANIAEAEKVALDVHNTLLNDSLKSSELTLENMLFPSLPAMGPPPSYSPPMPQNDEPDCHPMLLAHIDFPPSQEKRKEGHDTFM